MIWIVYNLAGVTLVGQTVRSSLEYHRFVANGPIWIISRGLNDLMIIDVIVDFREFDDPVSDKALQILDFFLLVVMECLPEFEALAIAMT